MKHYFKNLWLAVRGHDPFREEVDRMRSEFEEASAKVRVLDDMYAQSVVLQEASERSVVALQALTENLRERIREKDQILTAQQLAFRKRIEEVAANDNT